MAETAALLVEHRLPEVPWRQWVLSFEGPMAARLGYDRRLLGRVCRRFAKRVMQTLRQQSKRERGLRGSSNLRPGGLIVVQRFRSDLGLFVHLHALVTDGCFEAPAVAGDAAAFMPAMGLSDQDLLRQLQRLHADLAEHLEDAGDGQLGLPLRAFEPPPCEPTPASRMLVRGFGMQLHAAVTVEPLFAGATPINGTTDRVGRTLAHELGLAHDDEAVYPGTTVPGIMRDGGAGRYPAINWDGDATLNGVTQDQAWQGASNNNTPRTSGFRHVGCSVDADCETGHPGLTCSSYTAEQSPLYCIPE